MSTTDEVRRPGPLPLWEVPGWREQFGITAGITGRGEEQLPFDLGLGGAAPVGAVMERWRAFRGAHPGFEAAIISRQVHGRSVAWHDSPPAGWLVMEGHDGHATTSPGVLLLVTVADCVPLYLAAPGRRAVAILHAGWRGVAGGILAAGTELLARQSGATPEEMVLHAGVAISGAHYPVGADVLEALGAAGEVAGAGPWHVDLRRIVARQAAALGIGTVSVSGHCTAAEADRFFSHRRSGGIDGRMVAWIGLER